MRDWKDGRMHRQEHNRSRLGRKVRYVLFPIFTTLHCDLRSSQSGPEEIYDIVVPEELNLLDFSNIDVHINVTNMHLFWFEGSSDYIDRRIMSAGCMDT